jgi:hypothetical protein
VIDALKSLIPRSSFIQIVQMVGAMISMIRIQMNFQITPLGPKFMSKMIQKRCKIINKV